MAVAATIQRPVIVARRLASRGAVVRARRAGVVWELDLREGIDFSIWLRGYFERSTVMACRRAVREGSVVLDVGANMGAHTLHLARAVGDRGRVVAFEPSMTAFARLRRNIGLNPDLAPHITAEQVMLLGSSDAVLPPTVVDSWPLLRRRELDPVVPGRPGPTTGARTSTLDAMVYTLDLRRVDLIKIDVDGYECDVLDGATNTVSQHRPLIACELAPFVFDRVGRNIGDLLARFSDYDYRLWTIDGRRRLGERDVARLERRMASANALARPAERS